MARKNKKRLKRQSSRDHRQGNVLQNSIEDDLKQQRIRQKQREEERDHLEKTKAAIQDIGESDTSPADFQEPIRFMPQHLSFNSGAVLWPRHAPGTSSLVLHSILQQAPTLAHHRQRLSYWAQGKYYLENMRVNSRASAMYSRNLKWLDHSLPDGMHCAWDMSCKHRLHPSSRTFDVGMGTVEGDGGKSSLPTVVTAVQGGWGLFQPPLQRNDQRVHTIRCKPVYSIRIHEKSTRVGVIVRNNSNLNTGESLKFHCYSLPHATNYVEAELQTPVNDFCFGTDLAVFACPRYGGFARDSLLSPLFLPMIGHPNAGGLRSLNVQNFPQSDALRVESTCTHEKYLAFGHRNGQVSLLDLRQSHTCSAILSSGAVTDIGSNEEPSIEGHHFLHKTLSVNCNGFCVDPVTEQTLFAPFINTQHQPCLGVWSLATGDMVGTRVLDFNPARELAFVELSSRTTPGFITAGSKGPAKADPSSFGAWLKCGRFSKESIKRKVGSLHHISLPGRWE